MNPTFKGFLSLKNKTKLNKEKMVTLQSIHILFITVELSPAPFNPLVWLVWVDLISIPSPVVWTELDNCVLICLTGLIRGRLRENWGGSSLEFTPITGSGISMVNFHCSLPDKLWRTKEANILQVLQAVSADSLLKNWCIIKYFSIRCWPCGNKHCPLKSADMFPEATLSWK